MANTNAIRIPKTSQPPIAPRPEDAPSSTALPISKPAKDDEIPKRIKNKYFFISLATSFVFRL